MYVSGVGASSLYGYTKEYGQKSTDDVSQKVVAQILELDTDGDGALSVEESGVSSELFNQADSNGDGLVSEEELLAMMQSFRPSGPPPEADPAEMAAGIIEENDANGDGVLTLEDGGIVEAILNAADEDEDGEVTEEELVAMMEEGRPQGPPPEMDQAGGTAGDMAAQIMEELDSDGDGGLSIGETAASEEEFDALDTNEDGIVSQAELEAAMINLMAAIQESGLGFGAQAVNAAGGMAAYQQEIDRVVMDAVTGDGAENGTAGILSETGETGSISVTA
jgi:hypothetical protein